MAQDTPDRPEATNDPRPHLTEPEPGPPGTDWLEVFYDLIYGVAIIELTNLLDERPDWKDLLEFVAIFLPIWWIWMGWTVYVARVEADDPPHRVLTFAQMFAIAAMAVQVHEHSAASVTFALAFVGARLCLLAMYWRAGRRIPEMAPIVRIYMRGFGLGALLWAISIFAPLPARYWLWGAGLLVDFTTPWLRRRTLERVPLDSSHLVERLGSFSSIAISVAVTGVVAGIAGQKVTPSATLAAVLSFTLAVCVWWLYSAFLEKHDLRGILGAGQPYIYGHLPLVLALCVLSAGVRRVILSAGTGIADPATSWLLGGGLAAWLGSMIYLRGRVARTSQPVIYGLYIVAMGAAGVVVLAGEHISAQVDLAILVAPLAVFLVFVSRTQRPMSTTTAG